MIREVVKYGHPVLRQKGEQIGAITPSIRALVEDLLETMYSARGIGLAAQQIGLPLQITVVDVRGLERPSTLEIDGKPADIAAFMPLVLINPQLKTFGQRIFDTEGCLSFPEIFIEIERPETIEVIALDDKGQRIEFRCGGFLARAIQHEVDHLNGVLFIDRMDSQTKAELKPMLSKLQSGTKQRLRKVDTPVV